VADPNFTPAFLRRVAELEAVISAAERDALDRALARIITDPFLPERFPTFYDPTLPTYFVRSDPFLIEFAVDEETDSVTFISLFYRSQIRRN
jgi:hypothetical protein